jgi:hypothetical protein
MKKIAYNNINISIESGPINRIFRNSSQNLKIHNKSMRWRTKAHTTAEQWIGALQPRPPRTIEDIKRTIWVRETMTQTHR